MRSNRSNNRSNSNSREDNRNSRSNNRGRSGSSSRNNSSSRSKSRGNKADADKYNMLTFGQCYGKFVDTRRGGEAFKVSIVLKRDADGNDFCIDEQENEYSHEEAVKLLAEALLSGKRINLYMFESDYDSDYDDTHSGNARIDIKGIEPEADEDEDDEEEPAPAKKKQTSRGKSTTGKAAKATTKRRNYEQEIVEADDENDDDDVGEITDEELEDLPM